MIIYHASYCKITAEFLCAVSLNGYHRYSLAVLYFCVPSVVQKGKREIYLRGAYFICHTGQRWDLLFSLDNIFVDVFLCLRVLYGFLTAQVKSRSFCGWEKKKATTNGERRRVEEWKWQQWNRGK